VSCIARYPGLLLRSLAPSLAQQPADDPRRKRSRYARKLSSLVTRVQSPRFFRLPFLEKEPRGTIRPLINTFPGY